MIWLAVPEIVVQGFAALVVVLVSAGVLAVLAVGSRAPQRRVPAHLDPTRDGTSRSKGRHRQVRRRTAGWLPG